MDGCSAETILRQILGSEINVTQMLHIQQTNEWHVQADGVWYRVTADGQVFRI